MSDSMKAWQRLNAGNELFWHTLRDQRENLPDTGPAVAVFRCADSPVTSEAVFGQRRGSLVDVSTWGHVVDTGVLATLEYAVDVLEVPLIVVLGHHDCPAMRAALRAWQSIELPDGARRTAIEQALSTIVRTGSAAATADQITASHVVSVGSTILERSPVIARRVDAGLCGIVCATTDDEGRVRPYATVGALGETGDSLLDRV